MQLIWLKKMAVMLYIFTKDNIRMFVSDKEIYRIVVAGVGDALRPNGFIKARSNRNERTWEKSNNWRTLEVLLRRQFGSQYMMHIYLKFAPVGYGCFAQFDLQLPRPSIWISRKRFDNLIRIKIQELLQWPKKYDSPNKCLYALDHEIKQDGYPLHNLESVAYSEIKAYLTALTGITAHN